MEASSSVHPSQASRPKVFSAGLSSSFSSCASSSSSGESTPLLTIEFGGRSIKFQAVGGSLNVTASLGRDFFGAEVDGIPKEWLHGLETVERQQEVTQFLSNSRFSLDGKKVTRLGEWNSETHRGYLKEATFQRGINELNRTVESHLPKGTHGFRECELRHPNPGAQGTYGWADKVGLRNWSDLPIALIAYYNAEAASVEKAGLSLSSSGGDAPVRVDRADDAPLRDVRLKRAMEHLGQAIALRREGNIHEAYRHLGAGLRPLQDFFAHNSGGYHARIGDPHYIEPNYSPVSNIKEPGATRPLSQRYSDTATMTEMYLLLYRFATEPAFSDSGEFARQCAKIGLSDRIAAMTAPHRLKDLPVEFVHYFNQMAEKLSLEASASYSAAEGLVWTRHEESESKEKLAIALRALNADMAAFRKLLVSFDQNSPRLREMEKLSGWIVEQLEGDLPEKAEQLSPFLVEISKACLTCMHLANERPENAYGEALMKMRLLADSAVTKARQANSLFLKTSPTHGSSQLEPLISSLERSPLGIHLKHDTERLNVLQTYKDQLYGEWGRKLTTYNAALDHTKSLLSDVEKLCNSAPAEDTIKVEISKKLRVMQGQCDRLTASLAENTRLGRALLHEEMLLLRQPHPVTQSYPWGKLEQSFEQGVKLMTDMQAQYDQSTLDSEFREIQSLIESYKKNLESYPDNDRDDRPLIRNCASVFNAFEAFGCPSVYCSRSLEARRSEQDDTFPALSTVTRLENEVMSSRIAASFGIVKDQVAKAPDGFNSSKVLIASNLPPLFHEVDSATQDLQPIPSTSLVSRIFGRTLPQDKLAKNLVPVDDAPEPVRPAGEGLRARLIRWVVPTRTNKLIPFVVAAVACVVFSMLYNSFQNVTIREVQAVQGLPK